MAEPVAQTSPPDIETEVFAPMCCSVCGRQDETLRDSIFPWVASALLVTTRRAFVGRWCGRHRRVQLGLAALITSTVGWLGVPWGVIHTPLTLIKLAGGGEDLSEENAHLLKDLAHYKQRTGDKEGALACLEESLKLADSPEARDEIRVLAPEVGPPPPEARGSPAWPFLSVLLAAAALGGGVGLLGALAATALSQMGVSGSLWAGFLRSVPVAVMGYMAVLGLQQGLGWALGRVRSVQPLLAHCLALLASGLAVYGMLQGWAVGENWTLLMSGDGFESVADARLTAAALLVRGGLLTAWKAIAAGEISDLIYLAVMLALAGLFAWTSYTAAGRSVRWHQAVEQARGETAVGAKGRLALGWAAVLLPVLGTSLLAAAIPQRGIADLPQALALSARGKELIYQDRVDDAIERLRRAIELRPALAEAHSNLGWALRAMGEPEAALSEFEAALKCDARLADAHHGMGVVLLEEGRLDESIESLRATVELDQNIPYALYNLGSAYVKRGQFSESLPVLEGAAWLAPDDPDVPYLLGEACYHLGRYEQARDSYLAALRLDPELAKAHNAAGWAYHNLEEHDKALSSFERAISLDPDLAEAYEGIGWERILAGKPDEAVESFQAAIERDPGSAQAHNGLGWAYYAQDELSQAKASFATAIELDPTLAEALQGRGLTYLDGGMAALARKDLAEAIRLAPEVAESHGGLGWAYLASGMDAAAILSFQQAVSLDPTLADSYVGLGTAFTAERQLEQAMAAYQAGLELAPEDAYAHRELSFVYLQLGRTEEALTEAQEAGRLLPGDAVQLTNLALAYLAAGEVDLAIEPAQRAVVADPDYDLAHYALGMCYRETSPDKARAQFELFLKLYWDGPFVDAYKAEAERYLDQVP